MVLRTRDSGLATEAYMYSVSEGSTPYHSLQDPKLFPLDSILQLLDELYFDQSGSEKILDYLDHQHPLMQYWTMIGLQYRPELDQNFVGRLKIISQGPLSLVSITAAETLCRFGHLESIDKILEGLHTDNPYLLLMSARAFELTPNKPTEAMLQARQIWEKLKIQTKDKRKGYDLYAYWSLCQVFDP